MKNKFNIKQFQITIVLFIICLISMQCSNQYQNFKKKYNSDLLEELLVISKKSILNQLGSNSRVKFTEYDYKNNDVGVFVRILKNGKERGCVGFLKGVDDLKRAARVASLNAAFCDPRFKPVTESELDQLSLEITVIGKFEEIENKQDFKIGRDSLLIDNYSKRGFLQAQIAVEENYSKDEFLRALCRKAGLDKNEYKKERAKIYKAYSVKLRKKFNDIKF